MPCACYAPVVRGIAETNARIEVRQNEQLIYSSTVSPGSFVIDDHLRHHAAALTAP